MENFIRANNEVAYRAAYAALYPKEAACHPWDEIEREGERVFALNHNKPPDAADIQTYGSRIFYAVVNSVNRAADAIRLQEGGNKAN